MMTHIKLENLTKEYNGNFILNQISHTFTQGQSIAFMGHNGCGKSTLLKVIGGLVRPTNGTVHWSNPMLFHYVPEKFMPLPLTARAYLKRMGELDGLEKRAINETMEALGEDFFLSELLDVPMKHLSKGSLQKIGVIQAFMIKPDVLLLDEPLSGQDLASQKVFIQKVNRLRAEGVTIFMACHEQSLVDAVAEETYTIQGGALIACKLEKEKRFVLLLENKKSRPLWEGMERFGTGYKLTVGEKEAQTAIFELLQNGWELRGMYDEENS